MTENEALDMLRAKLKCMELELLACIGKGCDRKCDNCDCNYAQGNMGEQKEALSVAIQALEKQEKIKEIISNSNQWSKEDVVVKVQAFCDIEKIVRSDTD